MLCYRAEVVFSYREDPNATWRERTETTLFQIENDRGRHDEPTLAAIRFARWSKIQLDAKGFNGVRCRRVIVRVCHILQVDKDGKCSTHESRPLFDWSTATRRCTLDELYEQYKVRNDKRTPQGNL